MLPKQAEAGGLSDLYRLRFDAVERRRKDALWKVLCEQFLQRYIGLSDTVVDLGAGYGEFINHIRCGKKYAVDLNEDTGQAVTADVTFLQSSGLELEGLESGSVDVVFASNFFEHLRSKDELLATLRESGRVLRGGGKLLVLQPNVRYAYREYWDLFDHYLPLSHTSLSEALEMTGFDIIECRPRFLPYSTKSRLPRHPLLLRVYLRLPPLQWLVGKQMFLVGEKRAEATS